MITILWSCFGWIFYFLDIQKVGVSRSPPVNTPKSLTSRILPVAETACLWDAYGSAKRENLPCIYIPRMQQLNVE